MVLYSSPENSCPILKSMYDSKLHADIQLSPNGKKISAHKAVLSSASDYFKHLIDQNVNIDQYIDWNILEIVIKFIYHGSVEITSSETAIQLLKTAHFIELSELIKHSMKYLEENMTAEVCLEVYFQAKLINESSLSDKAKAVIAREFKTITQSDSFKILSKASLVELGTDMQELISEDDIAEALLIWINNDKSRLTHFKEFLLLLKIENIERDDIIDQFYNYCTEKEEFGIIINALQQRKSSTNISKTNDLKPQSQKVILLDNINRSSFSLLEYDFSNNTLLKQTDIPRNGLILGFLGDKILFQNSFTLIVYDVLKKSICSSTDIGHFIPRACSKVGDNVYLLDSKNLCKLNLIGHSLENIVFSKQLHSDCYEFKTMCELNGKLKIMAYNRNYSRIEIVTYNPLNNLWNVELTGLNLKKQNCSRPETVSPHKNCLYYFNDKYLHKYNLSNKTVNSMRLRQEIESNNIHNAFSINNVLYVCSMNGLFQYMETTKSFEKLDILGETFPSIYGIREI